MHAQFVRGIGALPSHPPAGLRQARTTKFSSTSMREPATALSQTPS